MTHDTATREDSWGDLRQFTAARIALGRAGGSARTRELLKFRFDHALARDAVHAAFEADQVESQLEPCGLPVLQIRTAAATTDQFLRRPDLGRQLDPDSQTLLEAQTSGCDLVFIVSNGLSAVAAHRHAAPVLNTLVPQLLDEQWQIAPLLVARNARVALQDQVGSTLRAGWAVILLGERPGLGAADSLGAYLVHQPHSRRSDADRNCVSNIHSDGLDPAAAAETLRYLLTQSRQRRISGVQLKDDRVAIEQRSTDRLR
ncbi:MAG: ethanolamine ammonia-lyase subunit EutC [Planctomycetaceae bacterium]